MCFLLFSFTHITDHLSFCRSRQLIDFRMCFLFVFPVCVSVLFWLYFVQLCSPVETEKTFPFLFLFLFRSLERIVTLNKTTDFSGWTIFFVFLAILMCKLQILYFQIWQLTNENTFRVLCCCNTVEGESQVFLYR